MTHTPTTTTNGGSEYRKAWGRAVNSVVTLTLAAVAFSVMARNVDAGLTLGSPTPTQYSIVWGTGIIALFVAAPRAFTTMWPGGRKNIMKWIPAVIIAVGGALIFRDLMHVPWPTCILALLTLVGPIAQDWIDR